MPTEILRPDATVFNDGSIGGGAGSAHAAMSDDSDSTYVLLPSSGDAVRVHVGTFTLPAGAQVKTVTTRARCRSDSSTSGLRLTLIVPAGATSSFNGITTTYAVQESAPIASTTLVSGGLAQANIDALQVQAHLPASAAAGLRVGELYVDVEYATQPSVTVSAPTGTINDTSTPDVEWTYTAGTDGGPQTWHQVKVFSAAQYGAAGFNPSSSTATWDSSGILGSATSATVGTPLDNGTYRAYVRAAQTISGQYHVSEWDFEGFVMDAATPDAPTVTAVTDPDLARIKVTVTKAVGDAAAMETVDVERSDDGGSTWVFVRGGTAADPPGDSLIVYDYEAPLGDVVQYRGRIAGDDLTGPWGYSSTATLDVTSAWLKHPVSTALNMAVTIEAIPELRRPIAQAAHRVLNRRTPIVVTDIRHSAEGEATLITLDDATASALLALFNTGEILLLQTPDAHGFGSRFIAVGDVVEGRTTRLAQEESRRWQVPFVEVDRPADEGVTVAGLTYDDLAELYADYDELTGSGLTYGDLFGAAT